jgi:hypothetical protein
VNSFEITSSLLQFNTPVFKSFLTYVAAKKRHCFLLKKRSWTKNLCAKLNLPLATVDKRKGAKRPARQPVRP